MCIWLRNGKRNACGGNKKSARDRFCTRGRIFVSGVVTLVPSLANGIFIMPRKRSRMTMGKYVSRKQIARIFYFLLKYEAVEFCICYFKIPSFDFEKMKIYYNLELLTENFSIIPDNSVNCDRFDKHTYMIAEQ
jgi:hypothetical protein